MSVSSWAWSTKNSGMNERSAPVQCSLATTSDANTWSADTSGSPPGPDRTVPCRAQTRRWKLDQNAAGSANVGWSLRGPFTSDQLQGSTGPSRILALAFFAMACPPVTSSELGVPDRNRPPAPPAMAREAGRSARQSSEQRGQWQVGERRQAKIGVAQAETGGERVRDR